LKDLKRALLLEPSKAALKKFNEIVSPVFELARANVEAVNSLAGLGDALLPEMLSRQIRVEETAMTVGAWL
jgi:hypothetical protein